MWHPSYKEILRVFGNFILIIKNLIKNVNLVELR